MTLFCDLMGIRFISQKVFIMSFGKSQFLHESINSFFISNDKGYVDGFMQELTFAKRLYKHFLWNNNTVHSGAVLRASRRFMTAGERAGNNEGRQV